MSGIPHNIGNISNIGNVGVPQKARPINKSDMPFSEVLKQASGDAPVKQANLVFSKHAEKKLEHRRIDFSDADIEKISNAVDRLKQKGGKEGLLLYRDVGLIVNVNENKVITCVDRRHLKDNVFTNIDSVAIVE